MNKPRYLLDVNVTIALTDEGHVHHARVFRWFDTPGLDWGLCAFSEAGFLRLSSNPHVGQLTVEDATNILATLVKHAGYRFWPIPLDWAALAYPFGDRILSHQQITDAYLLGLAIKGDGVLVTLDKAIRYMAGQRYAKHLLVLE